MNENGSNQKLASMVGIVGAFLIVALLVYAMKQYSRPAPLGQERIEERKKALAELRQADERALNTYEMVDEGKGIVRLTVARAMELTVERYRSPEASRADLITRAEKASAAPPPPPPEENPYE